MAIGDTLFDCLIVGGGPAGLVAATYLGRFRRKAVVVDSGQSRAKLIPTTRNCPGFPQGIEGTDLLERLRSQAARFGTQCQSDTVRSIRLVKKEFAAIATSGIVRARSVIIATGVVDELPDSPDNARMIKAGALRLCPICDAYEVTDRMVGVIGPVEAAVSKAVFLKTYTDHVTVLADAAVLDQRTLAAIRARGLKVEACALGSVRLLQDRASVTLSNGATIAFDAIYPAMGCNVQSMLPRRLGAKCDEHGHLLVDCRQRTGIPGLYGIGDVVNEINQLAVAFGHAAIAATDVHNWLTEQGPMGREWDGEKLASESAKA